MGETAYSSTELYLGRRLVQLIGDITSGPSCIATIPSWVRSYEANHIS